MTQSQLTALIAAVLPQPIPEEPWTSPPAADPALNLSLRKIVLSSWNGLEPEDQELIQALARGASYDELIKEFPRFKYKVAITRAVEKCNKQFLEPIAAHFGEGTPNLPPELLMERILEVLIQFSEDFSGLRGETP